MKPVRNPSFPIRLICTVCLAGAACNHARILAAHGLAWNYGGLPAFICIFWTALKFIDALAVILLMMKPILGLGLALTIIVCDVVINSWVGVTYGFDIASFLAQALFLLFVISTVGIAWRCKAARPLRQNAST